MPPASSAGHGAPLCWLHGFTQTGQSAHVFRSILAGDRPVQTPDLDGHGESWDRGGSLDEMAARVVAALPPGPGDLGGYSLGARVALHVALAHPERVRRLVLLSGTRGIREDADRAARRTRDEALAARALALGAEGFVDEWLAQPMFRSLPRDPVERAARSLTHASGLAASLRHAGTGTQRWLGGEIASLSVPTLVLAGADDERFAREAAALAHDLPAGRLCIVPGAGHAAHLHQPAWTAALVTNFLDGSGPPGARHHQDSTEEELRPGGADQ